MKPFIIIDRFILNRVEQLSHCLQKTFGLRSQKSAQLCYGAFIANVLRWSIGGTLAHEKGSSWWWLGIVPVYVLVYLVVMPSQERRQDELNALGFSNPNKYRDAMIISRMIDLLFIALELAGQNWTWTFNFVLLTFSDYFQACDDLPPGKSRVRKFVDAIKSLWDETSGSGAVSDFKVGDVVNWASDAKDFIRSDCRGFIESHPGPFVVVGWDGRAKIETFDGHVVSRGGYAPTVDMPGNWWHADFFIVNQFFNQSPKST